MTRTNLKSDLNISQIGLIRYAENGDELSEKSKKIFKQVLRDRGIYEDEAEEEKPFTEERYITPEGKKLLQDIEQLHKRLDMQQIRNRRERMINAEVVCDRLEQQRRMGRVF